MIAGGHWWSLVVIGDRWWSLVVIGGHWWSLVVIGITHVCLKIKIRYTHVYIHRLNLKKGSNSSEPDPVRDPNPSTVPRRHPGPVKARGGGQRSSWLATILAHIQWTCIISVINRMVQMLHMDTMCMCFF